MARTVVSIFSNPNNDQVNFNLEHAPGNFVNARELYALECTENDPPFEKIRHGLLDPDIVQCAGERLYTNLSRHPAVREAIAMALTITQDKIAPLYIYLTSDKVEGLPWETLFAAGNFLALDRRWPIARIADTSAIVPDKNLTFRPPLKVSLVLSAAGVDSTPQWDAFYTSVKETTIELALQVFVCQRELKAAIEGLNDPRVNVQVEFLQSRPDLLEKVKNFAPHILHFFCHGSTEGGPYLQLATLADWDGADPRGSIAIAPDDLYQFSTSNVNGFTWLVALNCCKGAAPAANAATAEETYSLARLLVTNGFCAAVGMREPIASNDAHIFCQAFYPSVLAILHELMQQGNLETDFTEVEWARALYEPRTQLRDKHRADRAPLLAAAASREWTLPIIYVRPELFMLRVRFTNPLLNADQIKDLPAQIKLLRDYRQIHPDVPQRALNVIDTQIAALEAQLYA